MSSAQYLHPLSKRKRQINFVLNTNSLYNGILKIHPPIHCINSPSQWLSSVAAYLNVPKLMLLIEGNEGTEEILNYNITWKGWGVLGVQQKIYFLWQKGRGFVLIPLTFSLYLQNTYAHTPAPHDTLLLTTLLLPHSYFVSVLFQWFTSARKMLNSV